MNRQTVLHFAEAAHFGQKRKDGQDYITHPIAVAELALKWFDSRKKFQGECFTGDTIYAACLLHDVLEDTCMSTADIRGMLSEADLSLKDSERVVKAVELLTRPSKEVPILDYLAGIKGDGLATIVKWFDLEHNMSDLKPGNLLDKYQLCRNFLDYH